MLFIFLFRCAEQKCYFFLIKVLYNFGLILLFATRIRIRDAKIKRIRIKITGLFLVGENEKYETPAMLQNESLFSSGAYRELWEIFFRELKEAVKSSFFKWTVH